MNPIRILPALLLCAACGTAEPAADPPPGGTAAADTVGTRGAPGDARVESVRRRLDEAQKADEARRREAMQGIDPP